MKCVLIILCIYLFVSSTTNCSISSVRNSCIIWTGSSGSDKGKVGPCCGPVNIIGEGIISLLISLISDQVEVVIKEVAEVAKKLVDVVAVSLSIVESHFSVMYYLL